LLVLGMARQLSDCGRELAGLARFGLALALVGWRLAGQGLIGTGVLTIGDARGRSALRLFRGPVGELPMVWARCEILVWPPGPAYGHVTLRSEATVLWSACCCANRTLHDHVDVTGLGGKSNTDAVDMTMQTPLRPGLDRSGVWLCALGGAFRRISGGSAGVDRSESS
jgi:hypothetical protein